MLKQRVLTALWLLPLALAGFFYLHGAAFALFIGLVVCLGGWEWARLAGLQGQPARLAYSALVAAWLLDSISCPAWRPGCCGWPWPGGCGRLFWCWAIRAASVCGLGAPASA